MRRLIYLHIAVLMLLATGWAQAPASNPQALTIAAQAIRALTGGQAIADVTLSASVIRSAGSDVQTGTGTFLAKGFSESRINLSLTGGQSSEIRNNSNQFPDAETIGTDGRAHRMAMHNGWTDPSWFFPQLSSLAAALSNPNIVLSYVGQETLRGETVQHLRSMIYVTNQTPYFTTLFEWLSTMDFYLDAATLLPVETDFNAHPDTDQETSIAIEVEFSNYQSVNGLVVPFHIQRFVQHYLFLDVTVTGVQANTGLSDSLFQVQ